MILFEFILSYYNYRNGLKQSLTGPNNITYKYNYDANNQLAQILIPELGAITINNTHWNKATSVIYPGGNNRYYEYDPLMRIQSIEAKDPAGNTIMDYNYTYDQMNNVLKKNTEHGIYTYAYDDLHQLIGADNPTIEDEAYTYDAAGNRKTALGSTDEWSYNANNELLGYGNVVFDYDDNGNTIRRTENGGVYSYYYNPENRLVNVQAENGTATANYYYDPFGRRLWKEAGGSKVYFYYADEGMIGEFDASGNELLFYGFSPDSIWSSAPVFINHSETSHFFNNDHLGTPQKIVGPNGEFSWHSLFDSFGDAQIESKGIENNLRLAGQYYDPELNLHYNLNRFYDYDTGRYFRTDPIDSLEKSYLNSSQLVPYCPIANAYLYAENNPMRYVDPNGLWTQDLGVSLGLCYFNVKFSLNLGYNECCDRKKIPPKRKREFAGEVCLGACLSPGVSGGGSVASSGSLPDCGGAPGYKLCASCTASIDCSSVGCQLCLNLPPPSISFGCPSSLELPGNFEFSPNLVQCEAVGCRTFTMGTFR